MIVLTGGGFSGKTTIINKLGELGHPVFPESALIGISMFNGLIGRTKQFSWRMANTSKFQKRITELDIIKLGIARDLKLRNVFWDRGIHDGIVYCRMAGARIPANLRELAPQIRYRKAFVLETLSNFDVRLHTGRRSTRLISIKTGKLLFDLYKDYAEEVIWVKEMDLQKRLDLIIEHSL